MLMASGADPNTKVNTSSHPPPSPSLSSSPSLPLPLSPSLPSSLDEDRPDVLVLPPGGRLLQGLQQRRHRPARGLQVLFSVCILLKVLMEDSRYFLVYVWFSRYTLKTPGTFQCINSSQGTSEWLNVLFSVWNFSRYSWGTSGTLQCMYSSQGTYEGL